LSPQQQMKIKVQIAQRTANMKISSSSEQSSASTVQSQTGHAHTEEDTEKKTAPAAADDQKTDHHVDDYARADSSENGPQIAESTVASTDVNDGTDDGFAPAAQVDTNPAEKEVTPAALAPSQPSHHAKVVPVPSTQDTSDPWAGQADLSESSEAGDVLGTAAPTGTQSSAPESTDSQESTHQEFDNHSAVPQQPQASEKPVEPAQNALETGSAPTLATRSKSPISSVPAAKPRVAAENDVYSKNDSTEDTSGILSLDQVKEIFDVKAVTTIPAPNGANGSEQQKQEAKIIIPNKKERAKKTEATSTPSADQSTSNAGK
jgi:hypothetical protein